MESESLVCSNLWKFWSSPLINLFAMSRNHRLLLFCSPAPDPLAWVMGAKLQDWSGLDAFPPFGMMREVLNKFSSHHSASMILVAPFWPTKEWFPDLLCLLVDFPRLLPQNPFLLKQPHFHRFHQGLSALAPTGFRLSGASSERRGFQEQLQWLLVGAGTSLLATSVSLSGQSSGTGAGDIMSLLRHL